MKVCLYCHKEFENKSELAKFCSDSHRVMFNQNKKKKVHKIAIGKISDLTIQIEKLANMVDILQSKVSVQYLNQPTHFGIPKTDHVSTSYEKTFQQHMNEIAELQYEDEFKAKAAEIESSNLPKKQKDLLLLNMRSAKM